MKRHAMFYKGFIGSIEYCQWEHIWHGKIINATDLVVYENMFIGDLKKEFMNTVDDYLKTKWEIEIEKRENSKISIVDSWQS